MHHPVPPTDIVLTRHSATQAWLLQLLASQGSRRQVVCLSHASELTLHIKAAQSRIPGMPAPRVFGVIPLWLAAQLCKIGMQCWAVELKANEALRGQELDTASFLAQQPRLVRYGVCQLSLAPTTKMASSLRGKRAGRRTHDDR
jgi:putative CRISPR-associated protein (TIGR02620 family)